MGISSMRKTKIVCTIGPASESPEMLEKMILSGMNVARLNFSHGSHEEHQKRIDKIKEIRKRLDRNTAIMLDTKGPEIRTGDFAGEVELKQGEQFTLTTREILGDEKGCSVTYKNLPKDVKRGSRILIDDGLIELQVLECSDEDIRCLILNNGTLKSKKGINLPGVRTNLPAVTEKDKEDLLFGIQNGVDFVAVSFVRKPKDVLEIRKILLENGGENIQIISKIENQEGVENLQEILEVSDGIMVARGDMGVELPPEQIPLIQKAIIQKCNRAGKPVITATQMLDSMVRNPRPTRAEVADVANAVLDGSDGIMLSGETAAGAYPLESVEMMCSIALSTEKALDYEMVLEAAYAHHREGITNAVGYATCTAAVNLDAKAIVTATASGFAARMVSKFRPKAPIIASTISDITARRMAMVWGVYPVIIQMSDDETVIFNDSIEKAGSLDLLQKGDLVIFTAGFPFGKSGKTNMMKIHVL